jgi:predicted ATPase/class 3 adenylate cyclase
MLPDKASGTLTFLFTDLEGSTRLWERFPQAMKRALERHDSILRSAVTAAGGQVVKTTGDGLMAVFGSAAEAVRACLAAQRGLVEEPWPETGVLRVRMGLHSGEAQPRGDDYFGPAVIRGARIMAVGHGGQVLLSGASAALVADQLPDGAALMDLGAHRLKDLGRPEELFQLVHPALLHDFPPLATPDRRPNNLPTQASTFIGRDTELREIRAGIERESVRLLTLTGPGGTGKTRLALRVAADEIDRFDHGVFFIDLSAIRDTQAVLASIARTIGLTETADGSLLAELERQLHHQRVLLVLDNFEQVMSAAPTAVELLSGCPGLKLLVTSREALHVRGERLYAVPPLSLPQAGREPPTAAELAGYEAVQLFVERAQAVRPDFHLTNENSAAVADICLRVDGLPLAIELATARINLFSPEELHQRLGSRLALLRGGSRDLPSRQRTLRATIEWSYQLLEPGERRLFELLSIFPVTGLNAVEAVAEELDWLTETGGDTLDGLSSLLDKSLIHKVDPDDLASRLVMLETIREYAAERLDELPEFAASARQAHAAYFADFAKRQWQDLTGQRREAALAAMSADIDNLRLAWRHWVTQRDLVQLNKLVDSLWLLYDARGWHQETILLTNDLLDILSSSAASTPDRATQEITLRMSLARVLMATKGYSREVEEAYATALQPFEGRELPQLFPVLRSLASYYVAQSEFDKGARIGWEILRLAERQHDTGMLVDGHLVLGVCLITTEGIPVALEHLDEAITQLRTGPSGSRQFRLGNNSGATCFTTSAFLLWMLGYPEKAVARSEEAITLATQLQHPYTLAYVEFHCGLLRLWLRQPELVRKHAVQVLHIEQQYDFPIWRALGTCLLGVAEAQLGRAEKGLAQVNEGIALYQEMKTPPVFWPQLLAINAGTHALAGNVGEGLALLDAALELGRRDPSVIAEFSLLKGDLLIVAGAADADAAYWFQSAFDSAASAGARMTQLRSALRLCRLWRSQGRNDADRLLRSVYDTFTEGFATADLTEARGLLESLPSQSTG